MRIVTKTESQLLAALQELDAAVKTPAVTKPPSSLLPLFGRIDSLAAQLPPASDPELRHFLQRKSYEKARQRLQGFAAERGTCGH